MTQNLRLAMIALVISIATSACSTVSSRNSERNTEWIWLYLQVNVPVDEGIESHWQYGRTDKTLYERIVSNETSTGYIKLIDVRHFNDDDKLVPYEGHIVSGVSVYRIEHIVYLEEAKCDPLLFPDAH